jgi:hypothetical protein
VPLRVTIVTGPRHAGKSAVISSIVKEVCRTPPHYIRLAPREGSKRAPRQPAKPPTAEAPGVASATWLNYSSDRVYEVLPEALTCIHKKDRNGCVILEADTDPDLRHAFSYDCFIFVMAAPNSISEVFRNAEQAHKALQSVLDDTACFAREIYGMFADEDSAPPPTPKSRKSMSDSQIIHLLHTPLGQELATRIRLQPDYHGLIESDVVVVNTARGVIGPVVDEVVGKLEKLVARARPEVSRRPAIFCCDPGEAQDPRRQKLLESLKMVYKAAPARRKT